MLDALLPETRKILLGYNWVKKYLEGKMSRENFLDLLHNFEKQMISDGIDKQYINLLATADAESEFHRKAAHSRFVRFARKLGLDIATQEDKVRWIKSISSEKFFDILSVSSGLFRGIFKFLRWKEAPRGQTYVGRIGEIALEPPENSYKEFEKFFRMMQKGISVKNIDLWAVKLYFAIICAHMFGDGNGRVARNAYFTMRANRLLDEAKSSRRDPVLAEAVRVILQLAAMGLLRKEGFNVKSYSEADEYRADKESVEFFPGYTAQLKYIACKRVLTRRRLFRGEKSIVYGNWPEGMQEEFVAEYQKVRIEWFWMCIKMAEYYYKPFKEMLDKAIVQN